MTAIRCPLCADLWLQVCALMKNPIPFQGFIVLSRPQFYHIHLKLENPLPKALHPLNMCPLPCHVPGREGPLTDRTWRA